MSRLSVIIPCYNEAATMAEIVRRVRNAPILGLDLEIIAIDDASTDGTTEILRRLAADTGLEVIYRRRNGGKGAAIRDGLARATGDIVIVQDADLEYDPSDYARVLQPILDGEADVVYGSRFMSRSRRVTEFWHFVANRGLTLLSNMTTNLNLTDMETCYKAFRREVLQNITLQSERFGFEPEVTAKIARMKCRVCEVPIAYNGRSYDEGKKIGWKDGVRALGQITRYGLIDRLITPAPQPLSHVRPVVSSDDQRSSSRITQRRGVAG